MYADFERLLVPGCTDLPPCVCGKEMQVARTCSVPESADTHIRVYVCPTCHHEMRLTVWGAEACAPEANALSPGTSSIA